MKGDHGMNSTPRAQHYALSLLRCYPRAWRERYEEEAIAVLEERPATLRTLFDLLLGMLDAYLHTHLFTERKFVIMQQARNSQLNVFSIFVLCIPLLLLYIVFGPRILPNWDLKSPIQTIFILPNTALVLQIVLSAIFCAVVASLIGGTAFIRGTLRQTFAGRQKQDLRPLRWNLYSFLFLALAVFLSPVFLLRGGSYAGLVFFAVEILLFAFFSLQFISNLLRLRQGIRAKTLSWRFMQPTLLPGLMSTLALVITFLMVTQQFFILLAVHLHLNTQIVFDGLLALAGILLACTIISGIIYLRQKIQNVTFASHFLSRTLIPAILTTLAMLVILGVLLYHTWIVDTNVNALGWTRLSVPLLNIILFCFILATLTSCISCWRAFSAQRMLTLA